MFIVLKLTILFIDIIFKFRNQWHSFKIMALLTENI